MASKLSQWMQQAIDGHHVEFIPYDSFTDRKEIARGAYGEVAKAYWPTAEKAVALKSLFDNPESESDKDFDAFIKEFKLIRSVHYHDNVIRVFGISQDPTTSRYFMVLQYADGGSLRDYLQKNFQNLDWKKKISMGKQIASGLKCIHDQNIVHRDLHSKNILVNQDNLIITDFGLSKTSGSSTVSALTGMFAYLEPQSFIDTTYRRDKASDIYSFGVLLWEISSGRPPFDNQDIFEISNKVKNGEREKPVDGTPNDYRILYEWAWSQNPKDRPDINMIRAGLEKMLVDGRQNDNSVGSLTNSMKNTLNLTAPNLPNLPNSPNPPNLPNSPSFNQQNNNKRLSHNNMPQPYQPGGYNPNLPQNYTPQIYQPMMPYANNNNNQVLGKPLPQPLHNPNMSQGMTPVQQQLPNNASNVNYPPGMNNFQQPIYPTVNAGQSQPYHNTNQTLIPNNFNKNQQQFKPISYAPPNMNAQSMANIPTINAPIQAYQQPVPNSAFPVNQQYPGNNINQQALGANLNQPVPGNNQKVTGNNYNQKVPVNNYNQQALGGNVNQPNPGSNFAQYPGGNANQQVIGNNVNQVPVNQQAAIHYQTDNRQYQQGVQQPSLPNKIPVGHQPAGCKQILEKYEKNFKLKPTECKAGYHAGFGDIEGLKYHLSSCGESITSTYEFGKTNDLLCVIVARYCDNIAMVEDIFKLLKSLRCPSGQLNDPSKQPNLSWNSVKHKKTVLHYLSQNNNLLSGIDIISKDKKKPDDVSENKENKKKMETFHNHITSVIKFLVEDGCDINAKDDNERTVLGLYLNKTTFQVGFTKVIEVLLKNGANPNINIIVRTKNLNRKSSSKINVSHTTSNGSASNLGVAEGCITLPNMLFLAIWNRWPTRVFDLLKEHGLDINTKYDNLDGLGNLLMMCLEKSKNGIGSQFPYKEGLEWVLNNVPNICEKENLEAAKKLTDKNSEERKLIKHKIGKKKGWFGLN
ncbi:kinase-like protein [Gigaspora margarita]|uniref:Kinase-like protein n=1 Tax=Gigaspora margarita TaxID=4874 RepID=A0A8H4EUX7_GIGMA|nr:kinase-like protein [Gigaspora margarita]